MTNPGKRRTYNWTLKRPIPENHPSCNAFRQYVQAQIKGTRRLIHFEAVTNDDNCIVQIKMRCYSTGKNGPNKFRTNLFLLFPDADAQEIKRERTTPNSF